MIILKKRAAIPILIHIPFLTLLILSLIYYQERLYADSGYYLIQVINHRCFHIEHQRLVLVFSQLFPLAGVWTGQGLKVILVVYSAGHVLFFYILFMFTWFRLKDIPAGIALIMMQFAGIMQSYFSPQFEMYYGAGILILFTSIIRNSRLSWKTIVILVLLEILVLTSHPMSFLLMVYVLLFDFFEKGKKIKREHLLFFGILLLGIVYKFLTFSEYEQSKIDYHLNFQFNKQYQALFTWSYLGQLTQYIFRNYIDLMILFLITGLFYLLKRYAGRFIVMTIFFVGYILFMNTMYPAIEPGRYTEQLYFPLVIIVLLPFLFDFYRKFRLKWIPVLIVAAIALYHIVLIHHAGIPFRQRVIQMQHLTSHCQQLEGQRFTFNKDNVYRDYSNFGWSYPIETLLISSKDSKSKPVTLISQQDYEATLNGRILEPDEYIFRNHEILSSEMINHSYFRFYPGSYNSVNTTGFVMQFSREQTQGITLAASPKKSYEAGRTVYIPVEVRNASGFPLYSGLDSELFLSYHIFNEDGTLLKWEGIRTPLEADVYRINHQDMMLETPAVAGTYRITFDFVQEGRGWFMQEDSHMIRVR
jgi:hypothetical protein